MVDSRSDLLGQAPVLAVILAPGSFDGLCAPLAGHPLIAYCAAAAFEASSISHVLVAGDARLVEVVRQYSYSRAGVEVEGLPIPLDAHFDQAALVYALQRWNGQQRGPRAELAVVMQAHWPLYPRRALEEAIELFRRNPQAAEAVSVVAAGWSNRYWAPGAAGALAPLSLAPDRLYVETGHFRLVRLPGSTTGVASLSPDAEIASRTQPVVLESPYGVNVAGPAERQWAAWQVQFSNLDMVYPGRSPRPFPERVALLVMDFDGVLTDNRVWVDEEGHEHIAANRSDSLGVAFLQRAGVGTLVISMETNPVVSARCRKMKVPVLQGINDKAAVLSQYLAERSIDPRQVVYLGNDVNDLVCFPLVGCAVAVADSLPAVLRQADLVLTSRGGHAAVRELCDLILSRAGK